MKKSKWLLTAMLCASFSASLFAAACQSEHKHTWGDWTITNAPTLTDGGKAEHSCTDNDGSEEVKIPALTDSVWTKDNEKSTPATHTEGGKDVYTSVYGEVEVATDPAGHNWGAWVWNTEPTLTTQGSATRTCLPEGCIVVCDGTETKDDIPALSDTTVWSVKEHHDATFTQGETTVYESVYGTVTVVEGEALPLPYLNKTYNSFTLNAGTLNNSIYVDNTNTAATLTFDENGEGTGTAAPFDGKFKLTVVDYATGELSVAIEKGGETTTKKAYLHFDTGVIVMPVDDSFDNVLVLVTTGAYDSGKETATASAWQVGEVFNFGIVYSVYGSGLPEYDHYIFIKDNAVYFDVSFTDIKGQKLESAYAGSSLYKEDYLYITDSNGEQLAAYGYNKAITNHVVLDGKEGTYTTTVGAENASLFLSGYGTATLTVDGNKVNGTYTAADGGYDLLLTMDTKHGEYQLTFGADKTVTLVAVKVSVTYNMNGHGDQLNTEEILKNSPVELTTPAAVEGWKFLGWYLEETCETPAANEDGKVVFDENKTVYASWAQVLTVTVDYGKEGLGLQTTYTVGNGEVLTVEVPAGMYDGQAFEGFYKSQTFTEENKWTNGSVITEADGITTIYANWITTVPYYGNYYGQEVWGNSNPPSVSSGENSISIDADGNANGKFGWSTKSGVVKQYNEETGSIIIEVGSSNYGGIVDIENGVIVYNYSAGETLSNDVYVMLRGKTGVTCDKTKTSQWDGGLTKLATFAYTGGEMLVFIWNGRVWGNVSIKSTDDSVTAGNAYQSETFSVVGSNGKTIAVFKDGAFGPSDGLDNTYTTSSGENLGNIVVDGTGKITATEGELKGTYTITEGTTIQAIFTSVTGNASTLSIYDVVLDTANKTYTATVSQAEKVTVTLILAQDGLCTDEQASFEIISGTTPDLSAYAPKGKNSLGRYFNGWYEDAARSTPYTASELTENKTLYCGWGEYVLEELFGTLNDTGSHSKPQKFLQWTYSDANNGTWSATCPVASSGQLNNSHSYLLKITFDKAGTFSFDWAVKYGDSYDGLFVGKNIATNYPHDQSSPAFKKSSGSGTYTVQVEAGDFIYIDAFWDAYESTASDYAQVSNMHFVASN